VVDERLTLLGPPSEGVMFFQLGALRPNQDHHVMRDILCWLSDFWEQVAGRLEGAEEGTASELAGEVVGSSISITEETSAAALRRQLARPGLLRVGGVQDALSALIAERCGLDALWASGLGIAACHGVPDANILTLGEVRDAARLIVTASRLPVIADCDTGFGEVRNLRRTVAEFEHAGVAAICIEDKLYPKRNSFGPSSGQHLIDPYEFATKIRAAKDTQRSVDLVVVARVESLIAGETIAEAMARARLYVAAGADAIVVHSKAKTPEQVIEFATAWQAHGHTAPLIAIPTTYSEVTVDELERAGFAMAIYANQSLRAAVGAMTETMRGIVNAGSSFPVEPSIPSVTSIFELTGEEEITRYDKWFEQTTEEARRCAVTPARAARRRSAPEQR
jgi:phosphoenolpyruvate phosphomutase